MNCRFSIIPAHRTVNAHIFVLCSVVIDFLRFAQLDKHEEAVAGVDDGVDEVAEDGDEVVDLLDLLPLQIEESLQEHIMAITLKTATITPSIIIIITTIIIIIIITIAIVIT